MSSQVVFTNKARCRDCYRCLRVCPVKAIRMEGGQASVVEERCIACGTCIRECPQGAKSFRNDLERAMRLLDGGGVVAVSVAPSFVAVFNEWQRRRLPSALRKLGFAYVGETAVGAYHVARQSAQLVAAKPNQSHICSACPAVVSYIERYQGDLVDNLLPVVSPMIAHARHIKARLGSGAKVIFVGPCVAKKAEAQRSEYAGLVDCVLTFQELQQWLDRRAIRLDSLEESDFDEEPQGDARFFPLAGGAARTASMATDLLAGDMVAVSGLQDVREALDDLRMHDHPVVLEPLFCQQGCINGPAMEYASSVYHRRHVVLAYASSRPGGQGGPAMAGLDVAFRPCVIEGHQPPAESEIQQVLEQTGKSRPEDQLNCGACGYWSCREKAIAVIHGMAEPEMCIPRMKRLAERRTDLIIESSPNGIVILDERLDILSMNQAFRRFFMCSEATLGKRVSYLMDPHPFEQLATSDQDLIDLVVRHEKYNLTCRQILYPLREEKQYVGIFVNITSSQDSQQKLDELRQQTLLQARELLDHQISMAQKIAQFLGESTAGSQQLVENLLRQAQEEGDAGPQGRDWKWDISTSK